MRTGRISLADVVVLATAVLLALPVLAMSMRRTRDVGNREKCASNLRQVGLAIQMYAVANRGAFPRTNWHPLVDSSLVPTAYTGADASNSFAPNGPADNDVTAAFFLALKTQPGIPAEAFTCPTDLRATPLPGNPAMMSNWPGRQNLSYSYLNPYLSLAARRAGLKLNFMLGSDFALAADMNPGGNVLTQLIPESPREQMRQGNSAIHGGEGQNVLYADGHVEFQLTPFCGEFRPGGGSNLFRDNIYTAGGPNSVNPKGPTPVVWSAPQDQLDSVLLPVAPEGPVAILLPEPGVFMLLRFAGTALVLILFVTLLLLMTGRRRSRGSRAPGA
jgi:prepilin-type processing-associated H-X9-DG protein